MSINGKMVFFFFFMKAAKEHFQKIKEDYQAQVEKLTALVDSGINSVDFIKVSGKRGVVLHIFLTK